MVPHRPPAFPKVLQISLFLICGVIGYFQRGPRLLTFQLAGSSGFRIVSFAYGFHLNAGGGGIYYFAPFYLLLALFFGVHVPKPKPIPYWKLTYCLLLFLLLPFKSIYETYLTIERATEQTETCLRQLRYMAQNEPVMTEDIQLFKSSYHGEKIDAGNVVEGSCGISLCLAKSLMK